MTMQQASSTELTLAKELLDFITQSPSSFHVVANFSSMLKAAGFQELQEAERWTLTPGGKYFVTRNGSALIAFTVPTDTIEKMQITAAHSDSPTFRIKHDPEIKAAGGYVMLNVEKYGGATIAPWLDRPLSVAGRLMVKEDGVLTERLVNVDRDLVLIPNLAIHMNRQINDGYSYQVQKDLLPLFGDADSAGAFLSTIADYAGVKAEDIRFYDLFLYSRVHPSIWGAANEYISSGKLDDLQCAYSAVRALMESPCSEKSLCIAAVFDNEEVGSRTKQGADSTFLTDTTARIEAVLGIDVQQSKQIAAKSFMISADNAHAVHPQHTEKADPVHRPLMNHGPVIKFSANQKYTTDALSAAVFQDLCERSDVPCQVFFNHSDQPGGSTLGNLSNGHLALNTVDIGLAQLAMHSPYETAGSKDTAYLIRVFRTFYAS